MSKLFDEASEILGLERDLTYHIKNDRCLD